MILLAFAVVFTIGTYVYVLVKRKHKRHLAETKSLLDVEGPVGREEATLSVTLSKTKLLQYTSVFVICWFVTLLNGTLLSLEVDLPYPQVWYALLVCEGMSAPLQGLLNAIVYGVSGPLKLYLRRRFNYLSIPNK